MNPRTSIRNVCVVLFALTSGLVGCGDNQTYRPNFDGWNSSEVLSREVGGKAVPIATVMSCRARGLAENVHHYYSIVVDPTTEHITDLGAEDTEMTYDSAEFGLSRYLSNTRATSAEYHGGLLVSVDVKVRVARNGQKTIAIFAKPETVRYLQTYYKANPLFNYIKAGDLMMKVEEIAGLKVNTSPFNLPGVAPGDKLECRKF